MSRKNLAMVAPSPHWHDACFAASPWSSYTAQHGGPSRREETMKRKLIAVAFICTLALGTPVVTSPGGQSLKDKPEKSPKVESKVSEIMKQKLQHAQRVLEGIALNDFDTIGKNGKALLALSAKAEWRVFPTPTYLMHSNDFQRTAEKLIKSAKDKNLDGTTLAYMELTMGCARCHKYVREMRMTRRETDRSSSQVVLRD
jgi:hypothetical protein